MLMLLQILMFMSTEMYILFKRCSKLIEVKLENLNFLLSATIQHRYRFESSIYRNQKMMEMRLIIIDFLRVVS